MFLGYVATTSNRMTPINKNYLGVSLVGLAIIVFWIFGMPAWNKLSLLNDAIAKRESILSAKEDVLKKIEELEKEYRERAGDVAKISSVIPGTKNTAEFVSTVEAISQQTGLQLVEITMGGSNNEQQELQTMSIELSLSGTYLSLRTFLDLLEKNLRLVDVFEINVGQATTPGAQTTLDFRIKTNAYYLNVK